MTTLPEGPRGRSAWPKIGTGGTLEWDGKTPGRYYVFAVGQPLVGSGGWKSKDGNLRAVHGAVLAIQKGLNRRGFTVEPTGVFDRPTRDASLKFRREVMGEPDYWGGIGPSTAKALLLPDLKRACKKKGLQKSWTIVCGVVQNESAWDPGAVGYVKPVDIGLAQINGDAHPDMTEKERLDPLFAFDFIVTYLTNAMRALDGNIDHAIASYNLGITGAKRWIAAGCPDVYTPPGSTPRNVTAYIERIKHACDETGKSANTAWS